MWNRNTQYITASSSFAPRVQRPVRIMLDRNEDLLSSGGRHPFLGRYRVGFTSEGRVTALDLQLYGNGGISVDMSMGVRCTFPFPKLPNGLYNGRLVFKH